MVVDNIIIWSVEALSVFRSVESVKMGKEIHMRLIVSLLLSQYDY